jgi:hypothetical protein
MTGGSSSHRNSLRRREALALGGAAAGVAALPARADIKLTIWTGSPEIQPFYQAVAADYAKTHPGVTFDFSLPRSRRRCTSWLLTRRAEWGRSWMSAPALFCVRADCGCRAHARFSGE